METRRTIHNATLFAVALVLASCGAKKTVMTGGSAQTQAAMKKSDAVSASLHFVQQVSDQRLYQKNIVGDMSFSIKAGSINQTLPGQLRMRKDEVIRIQLFIPILGSEVGRLEFTPSYVLIVDRMHKEYIKADYTQVDFLQKQGINFYSLQALFWNQLLVPGVKKVSDSDLKKFSANLDETGDNVPVAIRYGNMNYQWKTNRNNGRITEANVTYKNKGIGDSRLNLKYSDFKSVGVKMFPATQRMTLTTILNNKVQEAKLNIEMKSVKTDDKWDAQTEVSGKYKQVSPKDVLGKVMSM